MPILGIAASAGGSRQPEGGVITSDSTYYYHTFTSNGTFKTFGNIACNYLVVAGGGSGGNGTSSGTVRRAGGGGGAGGLLTGSLSLGPNSLSITVGQGGIAPVSTSGVQGLDGGNSIISGTGISTVTATGGGGGGGAGISAGRNGGSGGGGGVPSSGTAVPGSGVSGQGYDGYQGTYTGMLSPFEYESGQGGGAGGLGASGSTTGNGLSDATLDAIAAATSTGGYDPLDGSIRKGYAGGGFANDVRNIGSNFKYGAGFSGGDGISAENAVNTSGAGGGGGGGGNPGFKGGNGGNGVVVIYYLKTAI